MPPDTKARDRRLDRLAPWACGAALALPALVATYLPMTDLPHQEEVVSLLRHYGDPRWCPPGVYQLNLGLPKQLFHLAACALAFVVPTDVACKLVVALSLLLIPLGAAHLARHLGRTPWAALVTAPLAIGWSFYWGLMANLLGLALWLFALPAIDELAQRPTARNVARGIVWMIVLYGAHESSLLLAVMALALFLLISPLDLWSRARASVPAAVAVALGLGELVYKHRDNAILANAGPPAPIQFLSIGARLRTLVINVFGQADAVSLALLTGLFVGSFAILGVLRWRELPSRERRANVSWREVAHEHRFTLLVLLCAAGFLFAPVNFGYGNWVYQRFLSPLIAVAACTCAPTPTRLRWSARLLLAALPLAVLAVAAPTFADASRAYKELEPILGQIAMGSSVAHIQVGDGGNRNFSVTTGGARMVAARGGRGLFTYAYVDYSPVIVRRACWWREATGRVGLEALAFEPDRDLRRFRYLLIHSVSATDASVAAVAMRREAHVVDASGEWLLLESNLPQLPLTAPEEPPGPDVDTTTLGARIAKVVRAPAPPAAHPSR